MFRRFELVYIHLKIIEIREFFFFFEFQEINMYYIELRLVMFGDFLKIVFLPLKWYHLVRNGRFSKEN